MPQTQPSGQVRAFHQLGKRLLAETDAYEHVVTVALPESEEDTPLHLLNVLNEYVSLSQYFCDGWVLCRAEAHRSAIICLSFLLQRVLAGNASRASLNEAIELMLYDAALPRNQNVFLNHCDYWLQKQDSAQKLATLLRLLENQLEPSPVEDMAATK